MNEPELDKTRTARGFVRSKYLTADQLDGIIDMIADGAMEAAACRVYGTSHTQFIRRVQKDTYYSARLDAARMTKRRLKGDDAGGWVQHLLDDGWASETENTRRVHASRLPY